MSDSGHDAGRAPQRRGRNVEQLLADARRQLVRLEPLQVHAAVADGAALVDIRSDSQRARDGVVPAAKFVPRNVLEWRLDPDSEHADRELAQSDRQIVLMCDEGYQSSLAAATLHELGMRHATDLIGGFQAWRASGLPVRQRDAE